MPVFDANDPRAQRAVRERFGEEVLFLERATKRAVQRGGDAMRREARQRTRAALGTKISRTWARSVTFPRGQPSLNATASVVSKAPKIISANARGDTILPRRSRELAIPIGPDKRGRGRFRRVALTPKTYEKAFGVRLVRVPLSGSRALLVDTERRSRGRAARRFAGEGTPVFLLVRRVSLSPRLRGLRDAAQEVGGSRALTELVRAYRRGGGSRGTR